MTPVTVDGQVLAGDEPQPDCHVILVDLATQWVIGDTRTGADGHFSAEAGELRGPVAVLAKCTEDPVGLAAAEVVPPAAELVLTAAPLWPLRVEVDGDGLPEDLQLSLAPVAAHGVPDEWLRFLGLPVAGVVHGGFAARWFTGDQVELRVQAGTWEVAVQTPIAFAANAPGVDPPTLWVTDAASRDGVALPRGEHGFTVVLDGPATVRLKLTPGNE